MYFRSIVCFLLILVLASSCTLKEDSELVMPASPSKLFVEGYLTPGAPIKLTLIESSSLRDNLSLQLVWNAKVELILADTTVALQNIFYKDKESDKLVNYANPYRLPAALAQDSMRLRVVTEDKADTLYAATAIVAPIKISSSKLQESRIEISCANSPEKGNRYYGLFIEYELEGEDIRRSDFYDYSNVQDQQLTFHLDVPAGKRNYRIILYRVTSANYHYQYALKQASRSNIDPFQAPVVLPTNVKGGAGIFTYIAADTLLIKQ